MTKAQLESAAKYIDPSPQLGDAAYLIGMCCRLRDVVDAWVEGSSGSDWMTVPDELSAQVDQCRKNPDVFRHWSTLVTEFVKQINNIQRAIDVTALKLADITPHGEDLVEYVMAINRALGHIPKDPGLVPPW